MDWVPVGRTSNWLGAPCNVPLMRVFGLEEHTVPYAALPRQQRPARADGVRAFRFKHCCCRSTTAAAAVQGGQVAVAALAQQIHTGFVLYKVVRP